MDYIAIIKKASLLNKVNKPRAALNILKHLYKLDASNIDIILEVVTAFEKLNEWAKARAMLRKGIILFPQDCDLWIRLSCNYQADKRKETALTAINKGLLYNPDSLPLLTKKIHLLADLGKVNMMRKLVDDSIKKNPQYKKDLLTERALIYQSLSFKPSDGDEQGKDSCGIVYAIGPLKKAINDLTDAMDCDEEDFQLPLNLARLYKQLNNLELALLTYDDTLSLINSETEEFRIGIQQEREDCLKVSRKDVVQIESLPIEDSEIDITLSLIHSEAEEYRLSMQQEREEDLSVSRKDVDLIESLPIENPAIIEAEEELPKNNVIAINLKADKANKLTTVNESDSLQENSQYNPDQRKVMSIRQDILNKESDLSANFIPTSFNKSARKFYDQVEEEIKKVDFLKLGDFEVIGLGQHLTEQVFLRLFVSRDNLICAAAIEIKPPRLQLFDWLKLIISGKRKTIRYVELESEAADGVFKITNNSANVHPKGPPNSVKIVNLSEKSSVYDVVLAHKIRLQKYGQRSYKLLPDLKAIFAFKERLRRAKNFNGESAGPVTGDELKELSENQFDKVSYDIKSYFEMIARQTGAVDTGALMQEVVSDQAG